jgi:hypothetical protein
MVGATEKNCLISLNLGPAAGPCAGPVQTDIIVLQLSFIETHAVVLPGLAETDGDTARTWCLSVQLTQAGTFVRALKHRVFWSFFPFRPAQTPLAESISICALSSPSFRNRI